MFNRAVSSIFGPTSPLRNEPTIDYNNTIHTTSASTYEPTIDSRFDQTRNSRYGARNINNWREPGDTNYNFDKIRHSDNDIETCTSSRSSGILNGNRDDGYKNLFGNVYDDSDEELNTDFNLILNNITDTGDKITKTNNSLPSNYPGKFVSSSNRREREANGYSKNRGSKDAYASYIDRQLKDLDFEISQERHTELNTRYNTDLNNHIVATHSEYDWETLVNKIDNQNKFLEEFNELIDVSKNEEVPKNIEEKYDALKQDYLKELKNLENFYKAYYRLVVKYRALKGKKRNPKIISLKEKVRLIKSSSSQTSVKNICDNLLNELQDSESSVDYYRIELDKANSRIKELEFELSRKSR